MKAVTEITASNSKGVVYTLAANFISHTGGPIGKAVYYQRLGIPDGKKGNAKRAKAEKDYNALRATYETVSSIAFNEFRSNATVKRVASRPLIDRQTKLPTGVHGLTVGLEVKELGSVTEQLENARLVAKKAFLAAKAKAAVPVVASVPAVKSAPLSKAEQAKAAQQLAAEQRKAA